MFKLFLNITPVLIFWGIFIVIVLQVPYPNSLTGANAIQLFAFFIPLFLAFIVTFNIFLKNIFISASISLGILSSLILKALDSLNLVTGILTIIFVGLLISYFRKIKGKSLTKLPKISKISRLKRSNH